MARGILLDSSVVIPHLRGRLDLNAKVAPDEPLFLPLTVVGELYKGVFKSSRDENSRVLLETFLQTVAVLHPDMATGIQYARIAVDLEKRGLPIPENDIWIAALAVECSMPLASRDAHFRHVSGLQLLEW
jgi:tRNA(fMet)-specific endonuclease VapC